ncbi:hypothetical protein ACFJIV_32830 [Mucilaginibacter sp. UC70_90]
MKKEILFAPAFELLGDELKAIAQKVVDLEVRALDKWYEGDPSAYLDIYSRDSFTYFDPVKEKKIASFEEISQAHDLLRGKVSADGYKMTDVDVQLSKDAAILTYQLFAQVRDVFFKWNCTEVFFLQSNKEWLMTHSNWSFIRPMDWTFKEGQQLV